MIAPILGLLLSGTFNRTVARTKRNGIFIAIAVLFLLTAYAFALVAAAIWLATIYGAAVSALLIAAGALLLGLIVLVIMAIINQQEKRRARERRLAMESVAAAVLGLVRKQPLMTAAIAAALIFGNLFGSSDEDD
jgi:ABC-type transport system involved in multi-copper enzyme maturation permease subunit